jgi:uncharacterized protein (TIGR00730 family)
VLRGVYAARPFSEETMAAIGSLAVFCGSQTGHGPSHRALAHGLGGALAARGIALVYGGGRIGLMGVVADAALAAGGKVIGVIPEHLHRPEVAHEGLSELITVTSMHERKQLMFELADGFAVLPGGLGTLDETIEIVTWKLLELHDKPLVLLDNEGYWAPLLNLIEHTVTAGFSSPYLHELFQVASDLEGLFAALGAAAPPQHAPRPERL